MKDTFGKTYEEMEETLRQLMSTSMEFRKRELYPEVQVPTREQHEHMEAVAWPIAKEHFKRAFDQHGMYTPFMEERERRIQAIKNS